MLVLGLSHNKVCGIHFWLLNDNKQAVEKPRFLYKDRKCSERFGGREAILNVPAVYVT